MEYCTIGSQYFTGLVTGALVSFVFTNLYQKKLTKWFLSFEVPSLEDEPQDVLPNGNNPFENIFPIEDDEREYGRDEDRPSLASLLENDETLDGACPDKNTIILRLTDSALFRLMPGINSQTPPEASNLDELFNKAVSGEDTEIFVDDGEILAPTTPTCGYVKLKDLSLKVKPSPDALPAAEERKILKQFNNLLYISYTDACQKVALENYSLHILYVGMGKKMPLPEYSSTTIGVRITDPNWNGVPSSEAVVKEIIDVGGVDSRDRGIIKL
jgi:hypothetical protein